MSAATTAAPQTPPSGASAGFPAAGSGDDPFGVRTALTATPKKQAKAQTGAKAAPSPMSTAGKKVQDVLEADPVTAKIMEMREQQRDLRAQRKALAAELKAAEKRRYRLRKRAKALTDEDLVQVLMMRKHQRDNAAALSAQEASLQPQSPSSAQMPLSPDAPPSSTAEELRLSDEER